MAPVNKTLTAILAWLHKGYPEGIPPKDFYPLLALLARTLRDDELDEIVATLVRENPRGEIDPQDVHAAIEKVKKEPPVQTDVRDVAARLAAVGWPLADLPEGGSTRAPRGDSPAQTDSPVQTDAPASVPPLRPELQNRWGLPAEPEPEPEQAADEPSPTIVQRVVDWLHLGYPEGVPGPDRVGILALLRRRLTDQEIDLIAHSLTQDADGDLIPAADAEALMAAVKQEEPTTEELERVASRLAAKGWALEA